MGNSLLSYLNKRLHESIPHRKNNFEAAGPVITISREVGCRGVALAGLLAEGLNQRRMYSNWKVFSKEIFYKSAKELNMESDKVKRMFKETSNYSFDQILNAFGNKNYKSNAKIVNTVRDVIYDIAIEGFCIIVGRGGHIIARDIKNALHIRFIAPFEFRLEKVMATNNLNVREAKDFVNKVEKERNIFRKTIKAESVEEPEFDLVVNCASFSEEQIVDLIIQAIKVKGILKEYSDKVDFF